ncbi:mucin TcMUCII [Trypanosoma cruzi cruzi]|nr:mucin TcMUCII [Trypanosoma cruzi cruzi]PWV01970.1 putative mucin TcMUCII [Trypanosoma cruzi]
MMMTCRLLCALLVLALCCCPSVCATANGKELTEVKAGETLTKNVDGPDESQKSMVSVTSEDTEQNKRADHSAGQDPKDNTIQELNTTTTTTTKAPTTTTTTTPKTPTTTTTTVPEGPSTTTTTHAPSRLREIDGSLSSSAWVCAPLLLAVSALVYTTVG